MTVTEITDERVKFNTVNRILIVDEADAVQTKSMYYMGKVRKTNKDDLFKFKMRSKQYSQFSHSLHLTGTHTYQTM